MRKNAEVYRAASPLRLDADAALTRTDADTAAVPTATPPAEPQWTKQEMMTVR